MTPEERRKWRSYLIPSLRDVAPALLINPVKPDAWVDLGRGLKTVAESVGTIGLRILALCLYPLSVIVLTPVLALSRVRDERVVRNAHEDFIRGIGGC